MTVPEEQSAAIKAEAMALPRGFGSVRVEACIDDIRWRTSVFPLKAGGYLLPVKAEIRKRAALAVDEPVTVELTLIG